MNIIMKKYIWLLAALVVFAFASCEKTEPFDTQSQDDAPLILVPYETESGQISLTQVDPETPLVDSVIVTPSRYTTVNWYLDGQLVFTGPKIEKCFLAGKYALTIEAVTTAGKRTTRSGTLTVNPGAEDPYSAAPDAGRHIVPGLATSITGQHLTKVAEMLITQDVLGEQIAQTLLPTTATDDQIDFTLPAMEDGTYYLRFKDADGKLYGADKISVHNGVLALAGYKSFIPNQEWVITGVNLENVVSVKVGDVVVTELTATNLSVTLTGPDVPLGEHTLSIQNADGSPVRFGTDTDAPTEVTTLATLETTLWEGSCVVNWGDVNVKILSATMEEVPVGVNIYVYYNVPSAEYHALRVTNDWWDFDLLPQVDGMADNKPNPYPFEFTQAGLDAITRTGSMLVTGFGLEITKVTYK